MRVRYSASVVATAVAVGSLAVGIAGQGGSDRVQPAQQSVSDAKAKLVTTPWKTFSTTVGRGTKVVVSTGGNITGYASPNSGSAVYEHIGVGAIGEGYVLCYDGSSAAYDLGQSASGGAAPTTTSSNVTRNTLDGRASLQQTFSLTPGGISSATSFLVSMTVTNRTGSPMTNVVLRRQVDFDIDTGGGAGWAGFISNHSRTRGTVAAFHDPVEAPAGKESHGIMMMLQSPGGTWETRVTNAILDPSCDPTPAPLAANFVSRGDFGDTMIFRLGTIPAFGSKTSVLRYMRY